MSGFKTESKNESAGTKRDAEQASAGEPDRATAVDTTENRDRATDEQPRVAKRPPGRLPTR